MPHVPDLDSTRTLVECDPSGIGARLLKLADQIRAGWRLGEQAKPVPGPAPTCVVVAGMGGSAIGGELIRGLADGEAGGVPIVSWRDYGLPAWADRRTLVVALSVSGRTEETRSALAKAAEIGAPCLAFCGPGPMAHEARNLSVPVFGIDHAGEPRAALGYTFVAPYRALQVLGMIPNATPQIDPVLECIERLATEWGPQAPASDNLAKQIAIELEGRIPVMYGARHLSGVAMRWKTQVNENADGWAFWEALPEANHNTVQGYVTPGDFAGRTHALLLASDHYPAGVRERLAITMDIMAQQGVPARRVAVEAPGRAAEVLAMSLLGDMTSYYLGVLRGRDPGATGVLEQIKSRLSRGAVAR